MVEKVDNTTFHNVKVVSVIKYPKLVQIKHFYVFCLFSLSNALATEVLKAKSGLLLLLSRSVRLIKHFYILLS